jgi:predicted amidophosphoribosyltransferase
MSEELICVECGDDLATEGYLVCSDCLEELGDQAPVAR